MSRPWRSGIGSRLRPLPACGDEPASEAQFLEIANKAKEGCPVSKVLKATISLDATLLT